MEYSTGGNTRNYSTDGRVETDAEGRGGQTTLMMRAGAICGEIVRSHVDEGRYCTTV